MHDFIVHKFLTEHISFVLFQNIIYYMNCTNSSKTNFVKIETSHFFKIYNYVV